MIPEGVDLVSGPYTADGIDDTYFDFSFPCTAKENLNVVQSIAGVETTLDLDSDYTVSLNADQYSTPGGRVTMTVMPAADTVIAIQSNVPFKQSLNLTQGGAFNPDVLEHALDDLVLLIGQVKELASRALTLDVTSSEDAAVLQDALLSIEANATAAAASAVTASTAAATIDGFENAGAWTTATTYYKNNLVRDNGSTYIVVADPSYTSGATAADDIAAGHIVVFAQKGNAGAGSGDVEVINNLSEFTATASTARANLGLGDASTKTVGTAGANVPLNSSIYGKHTIWIPAGAMTPRSTQGAAQGTVELGTNKVMLKTLDFDHALQDEFAQFTVRMPKSWNEGEMYAYFLWSHATGATAYAVVWGIQGVSLSDGDTLDIAAFGTAVEVTDTGGTTDDIYQSPVATMATSGGTIHIAGTPAAEDLLLFQIYRNFDAGGDTLDKDARLHGVVLQYVTDAHNDA